MALNLAAKCREAGEFYSSQGWTLTPNLAEEKGWCNAVHTDFMNGNYPISPYVRRKIKNQKIRARCANIRARNMHVFSAEDLGSDL